MKTGKRVLSLIIVLIMVFGLSTFSDSFLSEVINIKAYSATDTEYINGFEFTKIPYTSNGITVTDVSFTNNYNFTLTIQNNTGSAITSKSSILCKYYDSSNCVTDSNNWSIKALNDGESSKLSLTATSGTVKILFGSVNVIKDSIAPSTFTLMYDANGGINPPANQTGNGNVSIASSKPVRDGYIFKNWNTKSDGKGTSYSSGSIINLIADSTLYAIWQKNETPSNPDNPNPPSTDISEANIIYGNSANNKKTYDYRTTVTFTANVPSGGSVQWYVDGKPAGTDKTLTVKDMKTDYTVKVVVTDKNGNQTMDEEQVTIKHGFFDIIIWFFVHLFNPGAYDVKQ